MNKPLKDRGLSTALLNSHTEPMCAIKLATAATWNYEVKENILLFIKAGVWRSSKLLIDCIQTSRAISHVFSSSFYNYDKHNLVNKLVSLILPR